MDLNREQILILDIEGEADVGVCRRKSVNIAVQLGFDEVKTGEVAILVSELVTNVIKHGGGKGRIIICKVSDANDRKALEIWCCDIGNGIIEPGKAVIDGVTNMHTLGIGLGTIRRFSDIFELEPAKVDAISFVRNDSASHFNHCLRVVKWVPEKLWLGTNKSLIIGASMRPKPGETLCGDAYVINHMSTSKTIVAVIDGLGHGKEAHIASNLIKEQVLLRYDLPIKELLNYLHKAARGTRGSVIAIASINSETSKLEFAGIGNIEAFILSNNEKKGLISFGGILGHNIRTPHIYEVSFKKGDTLCLYSDGINTRWNINDINWNEHPQKISEYILTNYSRMNDDASILVINQSI